MDIKLKVQPLFPFLTDAGNAIRLDKINGRYRFSLDYTEISGPQDYLLGQDGANLLGTDGALLTGNEQPYVPQPGQGFALWDGSNYFLANPSSLVVSIVVTPSPLIAFDNATVGTVIGTVSVIGGTGTYTYTLTSNAGGKYTIVGNQIEVASALTAGTDTITIQAFNGIGHPHTLTTTVTVIHRTAGVHPTYFIYGF